MEMLGETLVTAGGISTLARVPIKILYGPILSAATSASAGIAVP